MPQRILFTLLVAFFVAMPADAESPPELVPDLVQVLELDAPQADVWKAFTTPALASKWMAPVVAYDLRTGGTMKTNYDKSAGIGGPGTIVHHIIALQAPHLAVMQTKAPENNPFRNVLKDMTGTWRFEALSPHRTRITLGMHGWPATDEARRVRAFFEKANPVVLAKLKVLFPDLPPAAKTMQRMRTLIGSWDAELTLGARKLIIRKEVREGPSAKSLISTTSFGKAGARRLHKHEQVWLEAQGACQFRALDDRGGSVHGTVRSDGEHDVLWDFVEHGKAMRLRISTGTGDTHRFAVLARGSDGKYVEQFAVDYRRAKD